MPKKFSMIFLITSGSAIIIVIVLKCISFIFLMKECVQKLQLEWPNSSTDKTSPLGSVWSWSAMLGLTCLF